MRCSACGGRTDADRSFCRRCGSAVFVEDSTYTAQTLSALKSLAESATQGSAPALPSSVQESAADAATRMAGSAATAARRARARQAMPQAAKAGAGCIVAYLRLAIFLGAIYYALSAMGLWSDVTRMAQEALRGETVDTRPVVNKFRAIVDLPPLDDRPAEPPTP